MAYDNDTVATLERMPFFGLSNYSLTIEFQNVKAHFKELLRENGFINLLNRSLSHEVTSTFEFQYYDEDEFTGKFCQNNCNYVKYSGFTH